MVNKEPACREGGRGANGPRLWLLGKAGRWGLFQGSGDLALVNDGHINGKSGASQ